MSIRNYSRYGLPSGNMLEEMRGRALVLGLYGEGLRSGRGFTLESSWVDNILLKVNGGGR